MKAALVVLAGFLWVSSPFLQAHIVVEGELVKVSAGPLEVKLPAPSSPLRKSFERAWQMTVRYIALHP